MLGGLFAYFKLTGMLAPTRLKAWRWPKVASVSKGHGGPAAWEADLVTGEDGQVVDQTGEAR